jgi:hypothetical protein
MCADEGEASRRGKVLRAYCDAQELVGANGTKTAGITELFLCNDGYHHTIQHN